VKTVAIIPVFNEESHVRRCLTHLSGLVDGIVVLDDGSTDGTPELLPQFPKVWKVLRTPAGAKQEWDDARNHARLNQALAEFSPDWVIRLDQDETFDEPMREHLPMLAAVGPEIRAFAFRRYILDEGSQARSASALDIIRMYRYSPHSRFAARRLHMSFEPLDVTRSQIRMTNIRFWHHTGFTERLREDRYKKFTASDPQGLYQDSYDNLLRPPDFVPVDPPEQELQLTPWTGPTHGVLAPLWRFIDGERLRAAAQVGRRRLSRLPQSPGSQPSRRVDKAS